MVPTTERRNRATVEVKEIRAERTETAETNLREIDEKMECAETEIGVTREETDALGVMTANVQKTVTTRASEDVAAPQTRETAREGVIAGTVNRPRKLAPTTERKTKAERGVAERVVLSDAHATEGVIAASVCRRHRVTKTVKLNRKRRRTAARVMTVAVLRT